MHANKKRYESYKKDYHHFIASVLEAMKPLDSSLEPLEVKNCTFRINRDIRFSKDKSPYKTNIGVWLNHNKNSEKIVLDIIFILKKEIVLLLEVFGVLKQMN